MERASEQEGRERGGGADMTATQKKEKEGEEGRERREKGQCTAQKMEGKGVSVDV